MSANLRVVTEDNSAKRSGPLDHKFISALLPTSRDENYYDTLGLYLTVSTKGRKWWRLKYVLHGKEKRMGLGTFPEVSLKEARQRRDEARLYARQGKDPKTHVSFRDSNISAGSTSFESVARKFIDTRKHAWTPDYKGKLQRSLEVDVFPEIGHISISTITRAQLLACLRKVEDRNAIDMAKRICQRCKMVFDFAIGEGLCESNIATGIPSVLKPHAVKHHASIDVSEIPELITKLASYQGDELTRIAVRLLLLTFVRTAELRGARWDEINFSACEWVIPAERMKMRKAHTVPLSKQAVQLLQQARNIAIRPSPLVFPQRNRLDKPMSENTVLGALYRMGFHGRATGHGFRSLASTTLNTARFPSDAIEVQLAHTESNGSRSAYNYADWIFERRYMMQAWADFLDAVHDLPKAQANLRKSAKNVPDE